MTQRWIGKGLKRRESGDKVTGRAIFVDDLPVDDMLFGATVRSPVARGRLVGIHRDDLKCYRD